MEKRKERNANYHYFNYLFDIDLAVGHNCRIRCEACHIIMSELNILLASVKDRSKPLMGYFEDVCRNIGFTFQPASWLENVCETIMYDKFGTCSILHECSIVPIRQLCLYFAFNS